MNSITDLLDLEDACYTRPYLIPSRTLIILLFLFNYISYIDSSTAKNTTLTQLFNGSIYWISTAVSFSLYIS